MKYEGGGGGVGQIDPPSKKKKKERKTTQLHFQVFPANTEKSKLHRFNPSIIYPFYHISHVARIREVLSLSVFMLGGMYVHGINLWQR